jgi:hypothetical protein
VLAALIGDKELTLIDLLPALVLADLVPEDLLVLAFLAYPHREHIPRLDELVERLLGASPRLAELSHVHSADLVLVELDRLQETCRGGDLMLGLVAREERFKGQLERGGRAKARGLGADLVRVEPCALVVLDLVVLLEQVLRVDVVLELLPAGLDREILSSDRVPFALLQDMGQARGWRMMSDKSSLRWTNKPSRTYLEEVYYDGEFCVEVGSSSGVLWLGVDDVCSSRRRGSRTGQLELVVEPDDRRESHLSFVSSFAHETDLRL